MAGGGTRRDETISGVATLRAEDDVASSSALSASVVPLQYHEADYTVSSVRIPVSRQTSAFKKEPATSGKVFRGSLNFTGASNGVSFLWQREAGKLFLDLNRHEDLTDDSSGVYLTHLTRPLNYQTFTNIHLGFVTPSGRSAVLMKLAFADYGTTPICTVDGAQLLLRPWDQRNHPFNTSGYSLDAFPFSQNCFSALTPTM